MHYEFGNTFLLERNRCSGEKNISLSKRVVFTFPKEDILVPELVIQTHAVDNGEESFLSLTLVPHPKLLSPWMMTHQRGFSLSLRSLVVSGFQYTSRTD